MQRIATASRRLRATKRNLAAHTAGSNDSGRTVPSQVPSLKSQRNTRQRRYGRALVAEALAAREERLAYQREVEKQSGAACEIGPDAVLAEPTVFDDDVHDWTIKGVVCRGQYFPPEKVETHYAYTTAEHVRGSLYNELVVSELFVKVGGELVKVGEYARQQLIDAEDPSWRGWYSYGRLQAEGTFCSTWGASRQCKMYWHRAEAAGRAPNPF